MDSTNSDGGRTVATGPLPTMKGDWTPGSEASVGPIDTPSPPPGYSPSTANPNKSSRELDRPDRPRVRGATDQSATSHSLADSYYCSFLSSTSNTLGPRRHSQTSID